MNLFVRLGLMDESPRPEVDLGALKKPSPSAYVLRFAFGAGVATAASIAGLVFGNRIGGILLAFPAILPASLTLLEHKQGRRVARIDATGAILGSCALLAFAIVASWGLKSWGGVALAVASTAWIVLAPSLYVLIVSLPRRRRKNALGRVRPTST